MDSGYEDLIGRLDSLKGDVRKAALQKSLRAMGKVVLAGIIVRAPEQVEDVHGVLPAGALKKDFKVRVKVAADEKVAEDGDSVTIGPTRKTIDIAVDVETGHSNRPRSKPSKRPRREATPAHPFVRPAFDATKDEALAVFEETMASEIEKAMNA